MQRDARHEAIIRRLLERQAEDREAREKRQLRYRQSLESEPDVVNSAANSRSLRLHKFAATVPCQVSADAQVLLDRLQQQFTGSSISFLPVSGGRQPIMRTGAGGEPKQIGWVEHVIEPVVENSQNGEYGLKVDTDGGAMLVLRFHYPATPARISPAPASAPATPAPRRTLPVASLLDNAAREDAPIAPPLQDDPLEMLADTTGDVATVDFTEIRPALELRSATDGSAPGVVWVTRPEREAMESVGNRDYDAFYVRFKLEVQAGIWSVLSGVLGNSPGSMWHKGTYYNLAFEPDATNGRIRQKTVDDAGVAIDIGLTRTYDASSATDVLLLYLPADILADIADIYFTVQGIGTGLKDEFFARIRHFWSSRASLTAHYGSETAAVLRMSQRVVPTPAQTPLLLEDWTNLRQALIDRYGEGGRNAAGLRDKSDCREGLREWSFATFPAGDVNIGLRVCYRQEWRQRGAQRGTVISTLPTGAKPLALRAGPAVRWTMSGADPDDLRFMETSIAHNGNAPAVDDVAAATAAAAAKAMKWPVEVEGSINTGVRGLAAGVDSFDTSARLNRLMQKLAARVRPRAKDALLGEGGRSNVACEPETKDRREPATYVYSRLQHVYEVVTRPCEVQNIILVAEALPTPGEIGFSWVKRHDWILAGALQDESFRPALQGISAEQQRPQVRALRPALDPFASPPTVRAGRFEMAADAAASSADEGEDVERERLYQHIRDNILHYQRAIWQQEDPQQRSMRFRKSGRKVPLEWRFELGSGPLSIELLRDRLSNPSVEGRFAAYASGREAELDQVIDPTGPIGFYGNYAVYAMRSEFAGSEMFSMLHFFKAPYLGRIAADEVGRIALDTDSVVIDAVRSARLMPKRSEGGIQLSEASEPFLLAGAARALETERAIVMQPLAERQVNLQAAENRVAVIAPFAAGLIAGSAGGGQAWRIIAPAAGVLSAGMDPGWAHEPGRAAVISARHVEGLSPSLITG